MCKTSKNLILSFFIMLFIPVFLYGQGIPKPSDIFGFTPGDDYKLADYDQMLNYYDQLSSSSDRIKKVKIGETVDGNPMILLFISSKENIRNLDKLKESNRKLAIAEINESEASDLARESKVFVWIDGGMHAREMAHAQMTPELAYRVVTEESNEMKEIRDNVVLLLMPVMNPDGLNIINHWYKRNLGTPYENSETPWLWQRYVGHDNNRDWFMGNMLETQAVMKQLYREWYPEIVYNHHQTSPPWARIFVPPFDSPVNPKIHPGVTTAVNELGAAMSNRFAMKNMPGVVSNYVFSMWWNGGGRTVPYFHNQIGILTETAHASPTPSFFDPKDKPDNIGYGFSTLGPSTDGTDIFYPNPWLGGESHFRDAVDYMITGSMAVLKYASDRRSNLLSNFYSMGKDAIDKGNSENPFAYVIPKNQWDNWETKNMINSLFRGGIKIQRAAESFEINGVKYGKDSYIIPTAQSFRPYLMDLLEPQEHPDQNEYPGGPPKKPYDITGWTLPMQMNVKVDRIDNQFNLPKTETITQEISSLETRMSGNSSYGFVISPKSNVSFKAVNILFDEGAKIFRVTKGSGNVEAGSFIATGVSDDSIKNLGLELEGLSKEPKNIEIKEILKPKVGIYKSWVANMDEGWTRWVMDKYNVDLDTLHNNNIQKDNLSKYNVIIIPSQSPQEILNGYSNQDMPEEFTGGIGIEGSNALMQFVNQGGTLITFDESSDYVIDLFGLPVYNAVKSVSSDNFFIPGSLIRAKVISNGPLTYGLPLDRDLATVFSQSRAFESGDTKFNFSAFREGEPINLKSPPKTDVEFPVLYSDEDLLMSGWALGAKEYIGGKGALASVGYGKGRVILFAFRPQFRGQPRGTYKLIFNSILYGTTKK